MKILNECKNFNEVIQFLIHQTEIYGGFKDSYRNPHAFKEKAHECGLGYRPIAINIIDMSSDSDLQLKSLYFNKEEHIIPYNEFLNYIKSGDKK